jgi:hypothetical protein
MRSRSAILVVAILLVAGFAALNWAEIVQPSPLSFGLFVASAPMGLILLSLLALTLVAFLLAAGTMRTQSLIESRQHFKSLEAQRELADKAEASRFTDLRQHLDAQLRQLRERDAIAATEFEKSVVQGQRELRTQLEQINRTLAARLTELEHRIDSRLGTSSSYVPPARTEQVPTTTMQPEREAQLHEERMREHRLQEERARVEATEAKPAEPGWRKWF